MELLNESTGEVQSVADYLAAQHALERDIQRLTHTEAKLKGELKKVREGREQAIEELRACVRETKLTSDLLRKRTRRTKGAK